MSTRARTRRRAGRLTAQVIKDAILFGIGAAMIVKQGFYTPLNDFNVWTMIFGGVLANVPTAQYLWALRSGSIAGQSSSPDSVPPPPSSPSSPSVADR